MAYDLCQLTNLFAPSLNFHSSSRVLRLRVGFFSWTEMFAFKHFCWALNYVYAIETFDGNCRELICKTIFFG